MRWLDEPRDEAEAALRLALDQAAQRTGDQIAQRRIWTRIAAPPRAVSKSAWGVRLGVLGVLGAAALGGVLVWPKRTPIASRSVDTPAKVTVPAERERAWPAVVRQPLLDGPATVRSDARSRTYLRLWGGTEVDLEPSSVFSVDRQNRPAIEKGRVSLSVPHQKPGHRFTLTAGPYLISVLGTRFQVRVAGESVGVDVEEGVVEVSRGGRKVRVEAGEAWTSPSVAALHLRPRSVRLAEPAAELPEPPTTTALAPVTPQLSTSAAAEQLRQAQGALSAGHPQQAMEILEALARGQGPAAENAAYELGKILRYQFMRPREALTAWYRYRARFPQGILRAETDMSIVDALLVLGEKRAALTEARSFLDRYPQSERRADMSRIVSELRGETRDTARREPAVSGAM